MRRYTLGLQGREFVIDVQELAADVFEVAVGGQTYEVTLSGEEELTRATIAPGYTASAGAPAAAPTGTPAPPRSAAAAPVPPATPRAAAPGGASAVSAPMPGAILEVHVKAGDRVERGQPLVVLEAMKMHNLIGAPRAGTIGEVCVAAGQSVAHGQAIVRYLEG
jgi:biotin carboxyl carrier protein